MMSRGVTWRVDAQSWSNWDMIPANAAYFIASKHAHFNDHYCIAGLAEQKKTQCLYVSIPEALEQFWGLAGMVVRWLGGFPIERGGANIQATHFIVETLVKGNHPLVIFPEGELFFLNDVVTPLKPGTALFALEGAKAREASGKPNSMYILPFGLKYVYPYDASKLLERKLAFCEKSFFGKISSGEFMTRILTLTQAILRAAEKRYRLKGVGETAEERLFSLSSPLIERLEKNIHGKIFPGDISDRGRRLMTHLKKSSPEYEESLFAIHCLDFLPGYLNDPTQERLMETLRKLERMITGNENPSFPGKRDLLVKIEPPVKVHEYLPAYVERRTKRETVEKLTLDLHSALARSVLSLRQQALSLQEDHAQAGIL